MTTKLTHAAGKRYAVFGLARSGIASAEAIIAGGGIVSCWDDGAAGRDAAAKAGLPVIDLNNADWSGFDALVVAPGVPLTHPAPHWTIEKARASGVEVIGDIELFFRERAAVAPNSPVIAITGTNGKSTTTALIAHLLREAGLDVQMGGNIGVGVLSLAPPAPDRFHVLELSSFQIDTTPTLNPTVGILLNITPDHLDRHGTLERYAEVKARLVARAEESLISDDDHICRRIYALLVRSRPGGYSTTFAFTGRQTDVNSCFGLVDDGIGMRLGDGPHVLVPFANTGSLRGAHNAQNAVAAVRATLISPIAGHAVKALRMRNDPLHPLSEADVQDLDFHAYGEYRDYTKSIERGLSSFPGLAHRMEQLGHVGNVLIINDSKATNADSTEKALAAFARDIYWIAGGTPKEGGIAPLAAYFPRVAKAYLIGLCAPEFARTLDGNAPYEMSGTLDVALASAVRDAAASGAAEPVVLLSPACASYDQFKSFEHRGDAFRALAAALPGFKSIKAG